MKNFIKAWNAVLRSLEKTLKTVLLFFVTAYRTIGTTHLGGSCRFEPSCSAYALEALKTHHSHIALWFITVRVCKCRPGGPYGYDPVPPLGGKFHATKER